jgi:hypothetical protein
MSDAVRVSRDSLLKLAAQARSIINPPGQIPPSALAGSAYRGSKVAGLILTVCAATSPVMTFA